MLSTKERSSTSQEAASVHSSVYPIPNTSHEKLVSASCPMPPLTHLVLTRDNLDKTILTKVSPREDLWTCFKPLPATWAQSIRTAELWLAAGRGLPKLLQHGGVLQEGDSPTEEPQSKHFLHPLCKWPGTVSQLSVSDQQSNFDRVKVSEDCDLPKDIC